MNKTIQVLDDSVSKYIDTDFEVKTLHKEFKFTEGPIWNKEGWYYFSDITANRVYRINEDGKFEIFIDHSGTNNPLNPWLRPDMVGSNGLAYDERGKLLACRHGSHEIARWDGGFQSLIKEYEGKPLNSPNDIVVSSTGTIYFSDPPYGLKEAQLNSEHFQDVAAVYMHDGRILRRISTAYQYPNGLCLSPDEEFLYICSSKSFENFVSVHEALTGKYIRRFEGINCDGLKTDHRGLLYGAANEGLLIFDNRGKKLGLIQFPTRPANLCFGGSGKKDLFVTAREAVYLVKSFLQ